MPHPATTAPVNDHAGVISAATLATLDHRLAETDLVVVTLPGRPPDDLAALAGRRLVLLAIDAGHLRVRGVPDGPLPSLAALLRAADYDEALTRLVDAILSGQNVPTRLDW